MVAGLTRSTIVRTSFAQVFRALQRLGVNVTPSHFYFPVPRLDTLVRKDWHARRPCSAVDLRLKEQVKTLAELGRYYAEQDFPEAKTSNDYEFHFNNGYFERVDAEIAYALVRQRRPQHVIEVGSGKSTLLLATALRRNAAEGDPGELTSIEPYPSERLLKGFPGLTRLLRQPVQTVDIETFRRLQANDILFIDSSHVVAMDSDVLHEFFRILPELAPGVLIHFHDIFTPLDYPEKFVMTNLCFWGEQYLLEAFLSYNQAFRVLWSSSAMQLFHAELLARSFPKWIGSFSRMPNELRVFAPSLDGKNVWPCSFWMEKL
ncbi:MAG TPA: class I SAM-dependent methyltransferase [Terriglobales bacterium]|nr:class I SAM-dependent methyltransferase [Terriglobales bacterium]